MAWIKTVSEAEATGLVQAEYESAIARAGLVWQIINRVADGLGVDLEEWMPPHPHADREHRREEA